MAFADLLLTKVSSHFVKTCITPVVCMLFCVVHVMKVQHCPASNPEMRPYGYFYGIFSGRRYRMIVVSYLGRLRFAWICIDTTSSVPLQRNVWDLGDIPPLARDIHITSFAVMQCNPDSSSYTAAASSRLVHFGYLQLLLRAELASPARVSRFVILYTLPRWFFPSFQGHPMKARPAALPRWS